MHPARGAPNHGQLNPDDSAVRSRHQWQNYAGSRLSAIGPLGAPRNSINFKFFRRGRRKRWRVPSGRPQRVRSSCGRAWAIACQWRRRRATWGAPQRQGSTSFRLRSLSAAVRCGTWVASLLRIPKFRATTMAALFFRSPLVRCGHDWLHVRLCLAFFPPVQREATADSPAPIPSAIANTRPS